MNAISQEDLNKIHAQIGRAPRGVLSVETRCPVGHPQVIKVYPLLENPKGLEPFPTLFWLTCPNLIEQIARLEHRGWIQALEQRLLENPEDLARYHVDHRRYLNERWETLSSSDRQRIEAAGWKAMYLERGIGGISNWDHIKCLHLQYAHHLARGNTIGRWVEAGANITPCV